PPLHHGTRRRLFLLQPSPRRPRQQLSTPLDQRQIAPLRRPHQHLHPAHQPLLVPPPRPDHGDHPPNPHRPMHLRSRLPLQPRARNHHRPRHHPLPPHLHRSPRQNPRRQPHPRTEALNCGAGFSLQILAPFFGWHWLLATSVFKTASPSLQ